MARLTAVVALAATALAAGAAAPVPEPCTAEETCYNTTAWRCVEAPEGVTGAPCTLDSGYNTTSTCVCSDQGSHATCVNGTYPAPSPGAAAQLLVIGDSVSMGYFGTLQHNLSTTAGWDVVHAPGNCDNTNWGRRCLAGWLGPDPGRWTHVTANWGLHDLAFPDNEHLDVNTYAALLEENILQLAALAPQAKLFWVTTTPVPTDPPPQGNKSCVLIPGRLEKDVLAYNAAAAAVVQRHQGLVHSVCDLHAVVTDHCGVGYAACDIAQCAGPHFVGDGFPMLGTAVAACVRGEAP